MKSYTKPEVVDAGDDRGRAFPALGLAVATGYLVGKAATSVAKAFDGSFITRNAAGLESVIA